MEDNPLVTLRTVIKTLRELHKVIRQKRRELAVVIAGVEDVDARIGAADAGHGGPDFVLAADKIKLGNGGIGSQSQSRAINDNLRAVIAAHHIHNDSHR